MKINPISIYQPCIAGTNIRMPALKQNTTNETDSVNFKGTPYGLILLVAKEGYHSLTTDLKKAKFKSEIAKKIMNPDVSNQSKQLVETLFALAKTKGKEEPKSAIYIWNDKFVPTSMTYLRIAAAKNLFKLIPEMKSDANSGMAAKTAMLNSIIETGEYIESDDFYHVFKTLPAIYDNDKEALLKRAFHDNNVKSTIFNDYILGEAEEKTGWKTEPDPDFNPLDPLIKVMTAPIKNSKRKKFIPEASQQVQKRKCIAETALLSTMDFNKHVQFFNQYQSDIYRVSSIAFKDIENKLLTQNGINKKNLFYEWYKSGFTGRGKSFVNKEDSYNLHTDMNLYEQALSLVYFMDFMESMGNDVNAVVEKFNIDEKYAKDLIEDYKILDITKYVYDNDELNMIYQKRIREKLQSNDSEIINSCAGLIFLSGKSDVLEHHLHSMQNENRIQVANQFKAITEGRNFINGNYQCKVLSGEYQSPNYKSIDEGELESWERADLSTPWLVR